MIAFTILWFFFDNASTTQKLGFLDNTLKCLNQKLWSLTLGRKKGGRGKKPILHDWYVGFAFYPKKSIVNVTNALLINQLQKRSMRERYNIYNIKHNKRVKNIIMHW